MTFIKIFLGLLRRAFNKMTVLDNLKSNINKVSYTTALPIDRVIYATPLIDSVTNSIGTYSNFTALESGLNQYALPLGIYTYNGGSTYVDFRGTQVSTSLSNNPTLPSVIITPHVTSTGRINFDAKVTATVGGGSTIPLTMYIVLLATDTPGTVSAAPTSNAVLYSSNTPSNPNRKSRTIAFSNTQAIASGVSPLYSYAHGMGKVPNVQFWDTSGDYKILGTNFIDQRFDVGGTFTAKMDSTNVYLGGGNPPFTQGFFRGYYES